MCKLYLVLANACAELIVEHMADVDAVDAEQGARLLGPSVNVATDTSLTYR
jgi:hypothetical protein